MYLSGEAVDEGIQQQCPPARRRQDEGHIGNPAHPAGQGNTGQIAAQRIEGGGSGGQKGIASIIERLGTQDFPRMRVGIGRPPGRMDPADYVLQDFSKQDKEELTFLFQRAVDAVEVFSHYDLQTAMNQFNGSSNGGDKA